MFALSCAIVLVGVSLSACATATDEPPILISGSASVEPITETMAHQAGARVEITAEGTTDGFDRFCRGETDINNASIPIPGRAATVDYQRMCQDNGVDYIELPVALGAVTLVVNDGLDVVDDLSLAQLEDLWSADSTVRRWSDLNPAWPDEEIGLYGRPEGSGTLEFFRDRLLGEEGRIRRDYQATDEIDQLSAWIAEDPNGIGFMEVGNYLATDGEIRRELKNLAVERVAPTRENTQDGRYPLSRPLFVYVATDSLREARVNDFMNHYVTHVEAVVPLAYHYPLPHDAYRLVRARLSARTTGSIFDGDPAETDVLEKLGGE
ncbi:Phosphate-binding protein PstS precursor [Corynebacterium comes]|uniref:Phosphate-binding protein PstS n=2 Tax=Corynebacterium comes TaxID=2675218 RepID=A0A6B8W6G5_9CORY|nr:Phosphate-binding protein PstS precursor [Corynebacterium comes]